MAEKIKNEVAAAKKNEVMVSQEMMDDVDSSDMVIAIQLKVNKMGRFIGAELESIQLGDKLDAVITKARFQHSLWRDDEHKEPGLKLKEGESKLVFSTFNKNEVEDLFEKADAELGLRSKGYELYNVGERLYLEFTVNGVEYCGYFNKTTAKQFKKFYPPLAMGVFGNKKYIVDTAHGQKEMGVLNKCLVQMKTDTIKVGSYDVVAVQFNFVKDLD